MRPGSKVFALVPLLLSLGACRSAARGDGPDAVKAGASDGPAGPTIELRLLTKHSRYVLAGDEARIEATLRQIEAAADAENVVPPRYPEPPQVDLTLRLTNRAKAKVALWSGGDPVRVLLRLAGPGAVTVTPRVFHTMEMRPPTVVTLSPGEFFEIPIARLEYGERGDGERAYWTRPGNYALVPSFETATRPALPGSKVDDDGFAPVTLVGPPLAIRVDER
ncbi:MAG TPA: hypothetical protein VGP07_07475 [Polyangia bacterium]|jgi:hypothetical protein